MLKENPDNTFRVHGTVVRDPQVFTNKDGSMKVAMTIAAEDEKPNPDGSRSFQYLPVETFYGRRYVEIYGDGVKDSVRKGDVVSASGRIEMHAWNAAAGAQAKLVLFCLDTPVVVRPAAQPAEDTLPFTLHMADGTVKGPAPAGPAASAGSAMSPSAPDPPSAPMPDSAILQAPGAKDTLPFRLNFAAPVPASLPDHALRQLSGPATTPPFVLRMLDGSVMSAAKPSPAAAAPAPAAPAMPAVQPAPVPAASAPTPAGSVPQLPGPATALPFRFNMLPGQSPRMIQDPAPAPAPAVPAASVPAPAPAPAAPDGLPFVLHMLPGRALPETPPDYIPLGFDETSLPGAPESVLAALSGQDEDLPFYLGSEEAGPDASSAPAGLVFDTAVIENPVTSPSGDPEPGSNAIAPDSAMRRPAEPAAPGAPGEWRVKSHTRTLKSGKTIIVRGHVARRRPAAT